MLSLKIQLIAISVLLTSCLNVESGSHENAVNRDIVGYEFITETEYFITVEDDEYFLRIPRNKDDPMRKFIGLPTLDEFRQGTWDESNYKGSDKYIGILLKGVKVKVINVVESHNPEVGTTYKYYATVDGSDLYDDKMIIINSLVDE